MATHWPDFRCLATRSSPTTTSAIGERNLANCSSAGRTSAKDALVADALAEMERLYKLVNSACDEDEAVLDRAQQEVVRLQDGDEENLGIWREMIDLSRHQFDEIYSRLKVEFDETLGESFTTTD